MKVVWDIIACAEIVCVLAHLGSSRTVICVVHALSGQRESTAATLLLYQSHWIGACAFQKPSCLLYFRNICYCVAYTAVRSLVQVLHYARRVLEQ
jgi:hypothetical protein